VLDCFFGKIFYFATFFSSGMSLTWRHQNHQINSKEEENFSVPDKTIISAFEGYFLTFLPFQKL